MTWTGVTLHENPSLRLQVPALTLRNASPVAARIGSHPRLHHCGRGRFSLHACIFVPLRLRVANTTQQIAGLLWRLGSEPQAVRIAR